MKVAIVGSGCSGLAALWALKGEHEVHLYESSNRVGGHTNTVKFRRGDDSAMVDTGFIVLNTATYPNLIRFLKEVNVKTVPTEMTFGISRDHGDFEWSGTSLWSVFAQARNLVSPSHWRMLFDVIRFNQFALDLLKETPSKQATNGTSYGKQDMMTIGEYLDKEGYSQSFRDNYLIPMTAAVWSTSPEKCLLNFPAVTLVRFMWNHHLLSTVSARPQWLTIRGGSKRYIDAILRDFPKENIHLNTRIKGAWNGRGGEVVIETSHGRTLAYDHVILATHGDQAYKIVHRTASPAEKSILSQFKTSENEAVLHSDIDFMPKRRSTWSAWNYLTKSVPGSTNIDEVSLTYSMNMLQHISEKRFGLVLVTLNPLERPRDHLVQGRWKYEHPLYTPEAIAAQTRLPEIQNVRSISYVGAWTKYGFHEDGFSSGLKAAIDHLGAKLPFEFVDSTYARGRVPTLTWRDYLLRIIILFIQILIALLSVPAPIKTVHKKLR